ncbi:zinc finger MYM-type protein 1 [Trichonephila clavipes]|nr:zinc finger MYM-type protein 1 [Trichonephila clavipes]
MIGLALRGTEEVFGSPNNDTFMGALGLLDEFDPFICELIEQRELRPKSLIPGQSYDNAANMSGEYNGVQDLLKEKNKFTNYGPCAVHSLNRVRAELVKVATEIVSFFGLVQQICVFFCASTHRWEILNREIKLKCIEKCLSQIRWFCHYYAVEALQYNYDNIKNILKTFGDKENEKID